MPEQKDKKKHLRNRREKVSSMLSLIEDKFANQLEKATLGDYVRLTQLESELEDDEHPQEVRIRWEDSTTKFSTD